MVRCVNVLSPPLDLAELDHNLEYATARIPRRSKPKRRRRESNKASWKTADLQRLMTDPEFRRQVASAMSAALPPLSNGVCISEIVTDMADVMLPISAEMAPRS